MITWNLVNFSALFRTAFPPFPTPPPPQNALSLVYFVFTQYQKCVILTLFRWALHYYLLYLLHCTFGLVVITIVFSKTSVLSFVVVTNDPSDDWCYSAFHEKGKDSWKFMYFSEICTWLHSWKLDEFCLFFCFFSLCWRLDGQNICPPQPHWLVRKQRRTFLRCISLVLLTLMQEFPVRKVNCNKQTALLSIGGMRMLCRAEKRNL